MRRKKDGTLGFITKRRLNNEQKYLESRIACFKNQKGYYIEGEPPSKVPKRIEGAREAYHAVPKAIEAANAGRRRINERGLHRLYGQCGNALNRRGVEDKLGAEYICVDFAVVPRKGSYEVERVFAWYAPQWFTDYANPMGDRRQLYKRFDKLKGADQDAIDSEIGLLMLGEV
jgi:hypothetical protein